MDRLTIHYYAIHIEYYSLNHIFFQFDRKLLKISKTNMKFMLINLDYVHSLRLIWNLIKLCLDPKKKQFKQVYEAAGEGYLTINFLLKKYAAPQKPTAISEYSKA